MIQNWYIIFVVALVSTVMAFVWYNSKVFRTLCMSSFGTTKKATTAMFAAKGFTYIAVNTGYWIISLTFMGGIDYKWA